MKNIDDFLSRLFLQLLPAQTELDQNRNFFEQGLDSMAFVEMITDIEREFNIKLPREVLMSEDFSTYSGVRGVIEERIGPANA